MSFTLFVAKRYLFAKRNQTFISVISIISILGVALGVASLIVSQGIMTGFSQSLQDKILGVNTHGMILSLDGTIDNYQTIKETLTEVEGIKAVSPFIYAEVMASGKGSVKGMIIRGIDPKEGPKLLTFLSSLTDGSITGLNDEAETSKTKTPGIIIGQELAARLNLGVGSRINLLLPSTINTVNGFNANVKPFKVIGIFSTRMYEYDSTLGYISLDSAGELLNFPEGRVSGFELLVDDIYSADKIIANAVKSIGGNYFYGRNWMEMNANLFAALKLEKTAMFIVLTLIILVASFSIVTALVMLVMEKTKDIAILMSMGATRKAIKRIFMFQGLVIGTIGTSIGFALGLSLCYLLKNYQFIKLPEGVYPMDKIPILLNWQDLLIIGLAAFLLCFLATIYPARQAAKLEPTEALRYE